MIASADAICERRGHELVAATAKTQSAIVPDAERRVAVERARLGELEKLPPTSAIAKHWNDYIAAAKQALTDMASVAAAAAQGEEPQVNAAGHQYVLAGRKMRAAALAAKVERCAEYG